MKSNAIFKFFAISVFIVLTVVLLIHVNPLLSNEPLNPSLRSSMLLPHLVGVVAYSAIIVSLMLAIYESIKGNKKTPYAAIILQYVALTAFLITFITGIFWAKYAWGTYWSWDPKETWSLIFLFTLVFGCIFTHINSENVSSILTVAAIQLFVMNFLLGVPTMVPGLHSYQNFKFIGQILGEILVSLRIGDLGRQVIWLPILVIGLEIIGVVPAYFAHKKGYNFIYWLIYGGLLFPIAIIHVFMLKSDYAAIEKNDIGSGMKKCPFCAELIKNEAVICRYCSNSVKAVG